MVAEQESELRYITELIDRQFARIDELFQGGYFEEDTYKELTLALINKINIIAVEEVLTKEDDVASNQTPAHKFPIVLGE